MSKKIRFCSIQLKMRDGESHWIDDFYDVDLQELEDTIEDFLVANPEINGKEISEIILTT